MSARDDVTVTVTEFGQVYVNGVLVAEVAVGVVVGRDELRQQLLLHRVAGVLLDVVDSVQSGLGQLEVKQRARAATGLFEGLLNVTVPHPSPGAGDMAPAYDRPYDLGYQCGQRLRSITAHLRDAVEEARNPDEPQEAPSVADLMEALDAAFAAAKRADS